MNKNRLFLTLLIFLIFSIAIIAGCNNNQVEPEHGNTIGNIINRGRAAEQDGWIYYQNTSDQNRLYKISIDDSGKTKLNDDYTWYINVVGDWVYYSNWSDSRRIYRIRTDGSDREKLNDDESYSLNVVGDWIYYTKKYSWNRFDIFKMRIDGSEKELLTDEDTQEIAVVGDWIYYGTFDSQSNYMRKIKTDGSSLQTIYEVTSSLILIADGWLYYHDTNYISRLHIDEGIIESSFGDIRASYMNMAEDWLYFMNTDDNLKVYRIKTDGTGLEKINDVHTSNINIAGGWIYYGNYDDPFQRLYRMRLDGSDDQLVE